MIHSSQVAELMTSSGETEAKKAEIDSNRAEESAKTADILAREIN